jgi:AcrR family transcriptional regulator
MIRSAARLIRARGLTATGLADVVADSGVSRGALYHHFPEGKTQLARETVGHTADLVTDAIQGLPAGTPAEVLDGFVLLWRAVVSCPEGAVGSVIAGAALDSTPEAGGEVLAEAGLAFRRWTRALSRRLQDAGVSPEAAGSFAVTALATMEGALVLARTEGSPAALDTVTGELHQLLSLSVGPGTTR